MLPIQCVFFVFGPSLCGVGGGGGDGLFILVPLKKTWGILDSGIAVHSYRHTNVDELDYGIAVHSYRHTNVDELDYGIAVHSYRHTNVDELDYGIAVHSYRHTNVDELDYGIAVHSYRHTNVDELDYGIAVHSTDKKTQCKSEAREATKKREGPCSTSVLNSELGCVQPSAPLHCNLTPGSVQPTAPLLCSLPVSWQSPAPVDSKSATWPLPSHGLHPTPFRPPPKRAG